MLYIFPLLGCRFRNELQSKWPPRWWKSYNHKVSPSSWNQHISACACGKWMKGRNKECEAVGAWRKPSQTKLKVMDTRGKLADFVFLIIGAWKNLAVPPSPVAWWVYSEAIQGQERNSWLWCDADRWGIGCTFFIIMYSYSLEGLVIYGLYNKTCWIQTKDVIM
jgi:hypothetical protein